MLQIYFMEEEKKKEIACFYQLQMSYVPFDATSFTQQFSFNSL